jgi:hypothetical protein
VLFEVRAKSGAAKGEHKLELSYRVSNLLIGPDQPLVARLPLSVSFASGD